MVINSVNMWKFIIIIVVVFAGVSHAIEQDSEGCCKNNICGRFPSSCKRSRYRSYDGSCNNLNNPQWGSAYSAYARLFEDSYSDGVHEFPRSCVGKPLMNPRDVSLIVFPDVLMKDPEWTVTTLQWGQVVAHDMSLTAGVPQTEPTTAGEGFYDRDHEPDDALLMWEGPLDEPMTKDAGVRWIEEGVDDVVCCVNGEPIPPKTVDTDPRCEPIPLPDDDPYNAPEGNTCINFYRTLSNVNKNCSVPGKAAQPLSAVTSFLDLSIVYGNSKKQAWEVRAHKDGKLKFVKRNGQTWLPQDPNVTFACNNVRNAQEPCYLTGDIRVNQNPQLALFQNLLMRYHNLIAEKLCCVINPQWDDEKCYQEARRILIAIAQRITYYEFLKIFLGEKNVIEDGLAYPNADGFIDDYNPNVNPQTLNEHATAAYRNYHTEIVGHLKMFSENRHLTGQIRLSDWFGRPSIIEEYDNSCTLTRGMSTQQQNPVDRFFDSEITQYFFRPQNESLGQDLRAIDIQRSRDHGVGSYSAALIACGLSRPKCFKDLEKYIPRKYVKLLKRVYKCVHNVELAVAAPLETLVNDTLAGPTFLCIMKKQFYRTRVGDRFFFENRKTDGAFTAEQLRSIQSGATMARLFCDTNKGVKLMQPNAFARISKKNALVNCNCLPQVDLSLWKESP